MSANEKTIQRLKENIKCLKLELSRSKSHQKKSERAAQDYYNSQNKFKTVFEQSSLG
ncbi:hypothetical protein IWX76_000601 [Pedobacter sp. CAN_A7]